MKQKVFSKERGLRTLKDGADFEEYKKKYPTVIKIKSVPTVTTLEKWSDAGIAKAVDGCKVEPDGTCHHGYPSWLVALGLI